MVGNGWLLWFWLYVSGYCVYATVAQCQVDGRSTAKARRFQWQSFYCLVWKESAKIKSYKLFKTPGQAQQIEFTFRSFFHFCTKKGCQRYKTISPLPGKKVRRPRVHCLPTYVSLFTSQTRAISGFLAIWWSIGVLASFASLGSGPQFSVGYRFDCWLNGELRPTGCSSLFFWFFSSFSSIINSGHIKVAPAGQRANK